MRLINLKIRARDLKDTEFTKETKKLQKIVQADENKINEVLPWAFALSREAARRTLGQRHFDVQLIAALALHEGKITEQKPVKEKLFLQYQLYI